VSEAIVISGVGVLSPAGQGSKPLFDAMIEGRSFFDPAPTSAPARASGMPWPMTAIDPADAAWPSGPLWSKMKKYANTAAHAAVATAVQAVDTAGPASEAEAPRCGTVMAVSSTGGDGLSEVIPRLAALAQDDPRALAKLLYDEVPDYSYIRGIPSQLGQFVSMANGFRGSNLAVYGEAGAGGLGALALAMRLIESGELDRVMVVGVSAHLSVRALVAFDREDALASSAEPGRGPFDGSRIGVLVGQGAAALVLERESIAASRGVRALASLKACEAFAAVSRRAALEQAVDVVLGQAHGDAELWWSHASGSQIRDQEEWDVVRRRVATPATSSKGTMGDAFECAALIDVALAVEALDRETAPPIGLLTNPDPELVDLDPVVGSPRPLAGLRNVLLTSLNHGRSAAMAGAAVIGKGATP
jgi:3-oxoacyl-[acyl-carrier-protein] synthase II